MPWSLLRRSVFRFLFVYLLHSEGAPLTVHPYEPPLESSPLRTRGFHWIQECPFHR